MGNYVYGVYKTNNINAIFNNEPIVAYPILYIYKPHGILGRQQFDAKAEAIVDRLVKAWERSEVKPKFVFHGPASENAEVYIIENGNVTYNDYNGIPFRRVGILKRVGKKWIVEPKPDDRPRFNP